LTKAAKFIEGRVGSVSVWDRSGFPHTHRIQTHQEEAREFFKILNVEEDVQRGRESLSFELALYAENALPNVEKYDSFLAVHLEGVRVNF